MGQPTLTLASVTATRIAQGEYRRVLPEYYALEKVVENDSWHLEQNVLDHVIGVFQGLEETLKGQFLIPAEQEILNTYLSQEIGEFSRRDILKAATLLHDIAKTDMLVARPNGVANSPGHELIGASKVKYFAHRLGLTQQAASYVERIVLYHGLVHNLQGAILARGKQEHYFDLFADTVGDIVTDLALLTRADLLGSDLGKTDKHEFDARIALCEWMTSKSLAT